MKPLKSFLFQKVNASDPTSEAPIFVASSPASDATDERAFAPTSEFMLNAVTAGIAVVPAEMVSIHAIDLPMKSARQRASALPFALEDAIACPLEQTHFALLSSNTDGMTLAASVNIAVIKHCLDRAPETVLVAEQMLIAAPEADAAGQPVWRVYRHADRVLVRTSDGTGFALHADMLIHVWHTAGKPRVDSYGAALPDGLIWDDLSAQDLPQPDTYLLNDLRQGVFQPARGFVRPLKLLAACIALACVFQLGIAALDVRAQRDIADGLRSDAARALLPLLPNASPDDAAVILRRQLTALSAPQVGSGFLPLMDRVAEALSPLPDAVQFRQLNWTGDTLRLTVEGTDLSALQRAEAGLKENNMAVTVGSASMDGGAARAELTVRP